MARNIFGILQYDSDGTNTFDLLSSQTEVVDIDLWSVNNAQFIIEATFATTASSTGIDCDIYYGIGAGDSSATGNLPCVLGGSLIPTFSTNSDAISMATVTASSSNVIARTYFTFDDLLVKVPRWVRLSFTNNDPSNSCTIKIYFDT